MDDLTHHQENLISNGFTVIDQVFSLEEVGQIIAALESIDTNGPLFRKTADLFAIRQVLKEAPQLVPLLFNKSMRRIISKIGGDDYFVVKSIYFDKPGNSNWFVAYHQDLTISVDRRLELDGFGPWTVKHNQFAVQPPLPFLQKVFTIRIHLDDTDENNGALKVIPGSHGKGICRPENIDWTMEREIVCKVKSGGVMLMKPLLLHASNRTIDDRKRRVIHIEFSNEQLPAHLEWSERLLVNEY
jgi:hypothetical protein